MKAWKKLLICGCSFVIAFLLNVAIDVACGPEPDPYDYYISFFNNNLQGGKGYLPFYYTEPDFLYDYTEPESEKDFNVNEWAAYLGISSKKEISHVLYDLNQKTDSIHFRNYLKPIRPLPDSLKNNTFLKALQSRPAAKAYFAQVKAMEPKVGVAYDRWNPNPIDSTGLINGAARYLQIANSANDEFIKLRCYYQAQRTLHYAGEHRKAMAIYDENIEKSTSKSKVKGWALALKAGEERWLGNPEKSAYLFSKIFALYPERRVQAYINFLHTKAAVSEVAKLAKNKQELAFIYAIAGFNTPGMNVEIARRVFKADPSSALTGVLLTREINKLESAYLTPLKLNKLPYEPYRFFVEALRDSVKQVALKQISSLKSLCNEIASSKQYPEPALGNIASAYLDWISGNTNGGLESLKAVAGKQLTTKLDDQRQLIALLLQAQQIQSINRVNEKELLKPLQWLQSRVLRERQETRAKTFIHWDQTEKQRYACAERDFYQYVLAPAYLVQRDTLRAALAILKSEPLTQPGVTATTQPWQTQMTDFWGYYLHSSQVKQTIDWKQKCPADAYLSFLTQDLKQIRLSDLYELLGTTYLREHSFANAVSALEKVPPYRPNKNWSYYMASDEPNDVFLTGLHDYPKPRGKKVFTKLSYVRAMANIESQVKSDPKNASKYYYQLANGYYNASFYGNSWFLTSYSWSVYDYGRAPKYSYDADYVQAHTAERYYLKARELSANKEFKARCTFMAAKCKQKQVHNPSWEEYFKEWRYSYSDEVYEKINKRFEAAEKQYAAQVRKNPYFKELSGTYAQTAFYKTAVHECSYLRDFLYGRPKPIKHKVILVD